MNSDGAVDAASDRWRTASIVSEWYALNPEIRRLWVYEAAETDGDDAGALHVIVVLAPVCDSDDISPIWLAKCAGWQRRLQKLIGRKVHLDCFDGDTEVAPYLEGFEHARVCVPSIAWRSPAEDVDAGRLWPK